jgi:uncharacterized protein (DUF433 family)
MPRDLLIGQQVDEHIDGARVPHVAQRHRDHLTGAAVVLVSGEFDQVIEDAVVRHLGEGVAGRPLDAQGLVERRVAEFRDEAYRYHPLGRYVVRAPEVCDGRPTFKYTRTEIAGVLDCIAAGENIDDIVAGYHGRAPREAVLEAIQIVTDGFLKALPELESA